MSEHGIITEAGTIRFRRILPGPIDRVWAFLTEPEKRVPMERALIKLGIALIKQRESLGSGRELTELFRLILA